MPRRSPCASVAGAALAALLLQSTATAQTVNLLPNPLELDGAFPGDYRNWAAVLAQVMLASVEEGRASPPAPAAAAQDSPAVAALGSVLLATHARLAALAEAGPDSAAAPLFPRFHVRLDADKLGAVFGHHGLKDKTGEVGGHDHHDPLWDAHMGLDHPIPPGCEPHPMPTGTPNMTDHNHDAAEVVDGGDAAGDDEGDDGGRGGGGGEVLGRSGGSGPRIRVGARPYGPRLVPGVVGGGGSGRAASKNEQLRLQLATPPQAPQPQPLPQPRPGGGRALRQAHDHGTTPPSAAAGAGDDHAAAGHDACHSATGHVSVHKLWASKAFINYAPCVLQENVHGLHAQASGLRFAPRLFEFMPTGLMAGLQALNVAPSLIYFAPMALNVQPQGVNIQPGLIYIGPMGANVQPQGVNVQPIGTSVMPTGAAVSASKVLIAPAGTMAMPVKVLDSVVKGPVDAPVGLDLTPPGQGGHGGLHGGGHGGGSAGAGAVVAVPGGDAGSGGGGGGGGGGVSTMPGMEGMTPEEHAAAMARMATPAGHAAAMAGGGT